MLEDTGLGGLGTSGTGSGPISGGSNVPAPVAPSTTPSNYTKSTIQQSLERMEEEMVAMMMVAGIPMLKPPIEVADVKAAEVTGIVMQTQQKQHAIMTDILDKWIENVRQIAEQIKKDEIKRQTVDADKRVAKGAVGYELELQNVSGLRKTEELAAQNVAGMFNMWISVPYANNSPASGAYPDPSFIAGCLACSPGAIRSAIGADSETLGVQLSVSPLADAIAVGSSVSGLPGDAQAASAMIAALLYNGAVYKANVDTLADAQQKNQLPQTLQFGINFATQIIAIVTAPVESGQPLNPERAAINNLLRLTLASMALNLLYRLAYGGGGVEGMSGLDMKNLLNGGSIADIPDPIVRGLIGKLVTLVNSYLPTDPAARSAAIDELGDQVDSKESADSMLETTNLFAGMLNKSGINTAILNASNK